MEIPAASLSEKAALGQGYDIHKEEFVGRCVLGTAEFAGNQESRIAFERSLDQSTMQRELGFEVGVRARYGLFSGSAAAQFASESSASDYADVTIYSHTVTFKNAKLRFPGLESGLTPEGQAAKGSREGPYVGDNWPITCGHEFVSQITLGAKLLISIKVEFSTREEKQSFSAEFSFNGPPVSVKASLRQASKKFGKRASLSVQAYQLGGDVRRLASIFSTSSGPAPIVMASLDNPEAVLGTLDAAVRYSSQDFPAQIDPNIALESPIGPAQLSYITSPWQELGLYSPPALIAAGVVEARRLLSAAFERHAAYQRRLTRILYGPVRLSPRQLEHFKAMQRHVAANLARIAEAATVAYTDFVNAPAKVEETVAQLVDFPPEQFDIRPESFAQWWDMKDLPGTLRSDKKVIDEIAAMYIPLFNNFDAIEDKGLALQQHLANVDFLALGGVNAHWLESPVFTLFADAAVKTVTMDDALSNLDPLRPLRQVTKLTAMGQVHRLDALADLPALAEVTLFSAPVTSVAPLARLTRLTELSLQKNRAALSDVSPLGGLSSLRELVINGAAVEDASSLAGLEHLEVVSLDFGRLRTIRPLLTLPNLKQLNFGSPDAQVTDAIELASHPLLTNLFVRETRISVREAKGWEAVWTRRDGSNVFDVDATHRASGQRASGTAVLLGVASGRHGLMITALHRRGEWDLMYWGRAEDQEIRGNVMAGRLVDGSLTVTAEGDAEGGDFVASKP